MRDDFGEMLDTSPAQRARYYAMIRAMTPEQRAQKINGLCAMVRSLAEAGIRNRDPSASPDQIRRRLAELLYGSETAAHFFQRR